MSLNKLRTLIHQVLLEEAKKKDKEDKKTSKEDKKPAKKKPTEEKPETKKSSGKLMDLKNELKSLKSMKESLVQYSVNEIASTEPITEFAHLQKFVAEIEHIKEVTGNLSSTLDEHITEVEGKIAEETKKIKEMMGLVSGEETDEKKKKPASKKVVKKGKTK